MSTITEQEIKQNMYNILMDTFVEMYDKCDKHWIIAASDTTEGNRELFYDVLQSEGIFCCGRNNYEESENSMKLDDYITSLSHILAERRKESFGSLFFVLL